MTRAQLFQEQIADFCRHQLAHLACFGASGTGKTILLAILCCLRLADPAWGLWVLDVEGDIWPICLEFAASPKNRLRWRVIHHLHPASQSSTSTSTTQA